MGKKGKKDNQNNYNDYLEKLKEWQDHQYNPGFYTGGNIPPLYTHTGRPKLLGWFWVITGFVSGILATILAIRIFGDKSALKHILPLSIVIIMMYGIVVLQLMGGLRLLKKSTSKEGFSKIKKALIIIPFGVLAIIILATSANEILLKKNGTIDVDSVEVVQLRQEYDKNYIILDDGNLVLRCNSSEFHAIWEVKVTDGKSSFVIEYEWNILSPKNGKILKIHRKD